MFLLKRIVGLANARNIDDYFLWGTVVAFVIDRRELGGYRYINLGESKKAYWQISNNRTVLREGGC